jgi:N-acetyl-anhydromuramyl-L-alanine amidase AmpD
MQIELNKVYTLGLTNASEVVCKIIEEDSVKYTVSQPLTAVPTEKGIQLIFTMFTSSPDKNMLINKSAVAVISETREEVSDHYLEATTGIKTVRNSKILLG